jgi:CBS domain containing-hemolysin-like protein
MAAMTDEGKLLISLAIIRISIGIFFLVWSIEKIVAPELAQKVFKNFYFSEISPGVSVILGIIQTIIVLAFIAGLFKTLSYGALLGMHTASVLSTYQQLLNPYQPPNHLFWAGVPVLGALIALFILRKSDRLLTFNLTAFQK